MQQISAFSVRIVQVDPRNLATCDAAFFGEGENGLEYCVKTVEKTPAVPAAEYLCHTLAAACGIAVPQFDIVELPSGALAFGSVWEGSAVADRQALYGILTGTLPARQIRSTLSRIYAFDMFVHNHDRHAGNYLCVGGRTPGHSLKAYDFSRAFTAVAWPLPSLPMVPSCGTIVTSRMLRKHHAFDRDAAFGLLDKIDDLPFADFRRVVEKLPPTWMEQKVRNMVVRWWAEERTKRTRMER